MKTWDTQARALVNIPPYPIFQVLGLFFIFMSKWINEKNAFEKNIFQNIFCKMHWINSNFFPFLGVQIDVIFYLNNHSAIFWSQKSKSSFSDYFWGDLVKENRIYTYIRKHTIFCHLEMFFTKLLCKKEAAAWQTTSLWKIISLWSHILTIFMLTCVFKLHVR